MFQYGFLMDELCSLMLDFKNLSDPILRNLNTLKNFQMYFIICSQRLLMTKTVKIMKDPLLRRSLVFLSFKDLFSEDIKITSR